MQFFIILCVCILSMFNLVALTKIISSFFAVLIYLINLVESLNNNKKAYQIKMDLTCTNKANIYPSFTKGFFNKSKFYDNFIKKQLFSINRLME